jgi:predicted MPP superfamily phosphohydrolase
MNRFNASLLIVVLLLLGSYSTFTCAQNGTGNGTGKVSTSRSAVKISLPSKADSVRFVIIGDTGTGGKKQQELADILVETRKTFPYDFVLMLGDNLYGGESPKDYKSKFEDVYRPILDQKVKFYAALGNHDEPAQRFYQFFNMDGKEYYRFTKGNVAFYCLNSNYMDKKQMEWLESELAKDTSEWKVTFHHHPPYSSGGRHGSDTGLRKVLEPLLVKYGVNAVFAGHDHFYERIKPQKGIYYFVSGAGAKLRSGDVKSNSPLTEKFFDTDMSFMLAEVDDNQLHFQVISRTGETVDSGVLQHQRKGN